MGATPLKPVPSRPGVGSMRTERSGRPWSIILYQYGRGLKSLMLHIQLLWDLGEAEALAYQTSWSSEQANALGLANLIVLFANQSTFPQSNEGNAYDCRSSCKYHPEGSSITLHQYVFGVCRFRMLGYRCCDCGSDRQTDSIAKLAHFI